MAELKELRELTQTVYLRDHKGQNFSKLNLGHKNGVGMVLKFWFNYYSADELRLLANHLDKLNKKKK